MTEERDDAGTTFEQHLASVEAAIRDLESDDLPLERSIDVYADAMRHLRACHRFLESAEARLELVRREGDGVRVEDGSDLAPE